MIADARRRAEEMSDRNAKADFLTTETRGLLLACSYQLTDDLRNFIRANDRWKRVLTTRRVGFRSHAIRHLHGGLGLTKYEIFVTTS